MVTMGMMMMMVMMMMMMMVIAALMMVWLMLLDSVHDQGAALHYMTKTRAFMLHCLSKQGFLPVGWSSGLQSFGVSGDRSSNDNLPMIYSRPGVGLELARLMPSNSSNLEFNLHLQT